MPQQVTGRASFDGGKVFHDASHLPLLAIRDHFKQVLAVVANDRLNKDSESYSLAKYAEEAVDPRLLRSSLRTYMENTGRDVIVGGTSHA